MYFFFSVERLRLGIFEDERDCVTKWSIHVTNFRMNYVMFTSRRYVSLLSIYYETVLRRVFSVWSKISITPVLGIRNSFQRDAPWFWPCFSQCRSTWSIFMEKCVEDRWISANKAGSEIVHSALLLTFVNDFVTEKTQGNVKYMHFCFSEALRRSKTYFFDYGVFTLRSNALCRNGEIYSWLQAKNKLPVFYYTVLPAGWEP